MFTTRVSRTSTLLLQSSHRTTEHMPLEEEPLESSPTPCTHARIVSEMASPPHKEGVGD
jgi:hypothetical protein